MRRIRYMDALKIFESPWVRPQILFPKFLMGFCSMNVRSKFEVRSFARFWDYGGGVLLKNWPVTVYAHAPFSPKFLGLMGFCSDGPVNVPVKFKVRSFTPKFPHRLCFPWEQVDGLWATNSEGVGLNVCAVSFQHFQPMWTWSWSTNVTDRWPVGRTDDICNLQCIPP